MASEIQPIEQAGTDPSETNIEKGLKVKELQNRILKKILEEKEQVISNPEPKERKHHKK